MADAVVYTDGSGTTGGPAGIAYVATVDGHESEKSLPLADATNQQAEILAAAYALNEIEPCDTVVVYSDSEYVVKGAGQWIGRWVARGWRTAAGGDVKNQPHWRRLLLAQSRHRHVEYRWVRGHNGHPENERADLLAGAARLWAEQEQDEHDREERELALDRALQDGTA